MKLASGNHWDHPKGHPEPGETPRDTAAREIREEGGVEVHFIGDFLQERSWILPDGRGKDVGYFLGEKLAEVPTGGPEGEILDTTWLSYGEARERITWDSGRSVLDAAEKYLKNRG